MRNPPIVIGMLMGMLGLCLWLIPILQPTLDAICASIGEEQAAHAIIPPHLDEQAIRHRVALVKIQAKTPQY
jgi:hypothetical protein